MKKWVLVVAVAVMMTGCVTTSQTVPESKKVTLISVGVLENAEVSFSVTGKCAEIGTFVVDNIWGFLKSTFGGKKEASPVPVASASPEKVP